jgi:hypothetical protein
MLAVGQTPPSLGAIDLAGRDIQEVIAIRADVGGRRIGRCEHEQRQLPLPSPMMIEPEVPPPGTSTRRRLHPHRHHATRLPPATPPQAVSPWRGKSAAAQKIGNAGWCFMIFSLPWKPIDNLVDDVLRAMASRGRCPRWQ